MTSSFWIKPKSSSFLLVLSCRFSCWGFLHPFHGHGHPLAHDLCRLHNLRVHWRNVLLHLRIAACELKQRDGRISSVLRSDMPRPRPRAPYPRSPPKPLPRPPPRSFVASSPADHPPAHSVPESTTPAICNDASWHRSQDIIDDTLVCHHRLGCASER